MFIKCDIANWDSQLALFETTKKTWGRVDLHVANAGVPEQVPLMTVTSDKPRKPTTLVVDVDFVGVIYGINLALFYMRQNGGRGGKIIVTASQMGIYEFPTGPIYGAAKAAVRFLFPVLSEFYIGLHTNLFS
jgi:NAD(P)-dependent dehydrogenase (short-subunit alcohol dehydrogenase family)